jgi:hypothetical protein
MPAALESGDSIAYYRIVSRLGDDHQPVDALLGIREFLGAAVPISSSIHGLRLHRKALFWNVGAL